MDLPADSPLRKPIKTIQDSGHKAAAIVQDLLTMARRGVAITDPVDLKAVIEDYMVSPECEKLIANHPGTRIETAIDTGPLYVMGSPVHLFKTVMNLVSNAAEAMPAGGTITIRLKRQELDQHLRGFDVVEPGCYGVLAVSDTGIGISEKDQKRIFEPFYTKKVMGKSGTGLGMSVVWATVKDHKGYIDIDSHLDAGTTFTLYFPTAEAVEPLASHRRSIGDYMGRGERILVVDDVKEQRDIASAMLQKLGYRVSTVPSGEAAIAYLEQKDAHLVVLDMIMDPGIDGLETYRQILERNPLQRAIITSGFSESERVKMALQIGAGAYIKKPYGLEAIGTAIRRELDRPTTSLKVQA
jgi:CheY-like chemotaxis protein